MKKIINIGIVAHVDAGKTTITENLLYYSGAIKAVGRVDLGNTQTDSMELERKRGITIKSSTVSFTWNDVKVNIIDTPGHVDFISEVERSLSVLDGAIIVISGVEGIQSQTRILFNTLKKLNIPTIIFINKLDRIGANSNKVLKEIKKNMSSKVVRLQKVYDEGSKEVYIKNLHDICMMNDDVINVLSDLDEAFLEKYISGMEIDKREIQEKLSLYAREGKLYPVFCGAAAIGLGIEDLLEGICSYLPFAGDDCVRDLSGVVFKIERTSTNEKKVYVRLFNGKISVRDKIQMPNKETVEKVKKINRLENGKITEAQSIKAGDIGILYGLASFQVGDVIGISNNKVKNISMAKPTLKTTISAIDKEKNPELFRALTFLSEEDPLLELEMNDLDKEIHVNLFGEVQMEILSAIIDDFYGIKVEFSNIQTIYKEAPKGVGTSIIHIKEEANPFYATVGLKIEPLGRGEGLKYISNVSVGSLPKSFQNAIEEAVIKTSKQGLFGWEVTDAKVTLTCGEFFSPVSTPADFRNVTPMVFMEALYKAQTVLLEPLHEFELRIPQNVLSKAIWDLETMRATFDNPVVIEDEFSIKGLIPVENSKEYKMKIASYTQGKGMFVTKFYGYNEVPAEFGKVNPRTTYDPLNKKEYLLHKLNAIRD
ncbi:ribosomal protection tetracycline resistance protein [Clostridium saccharoperbutylacetonicum]|uniref:Small GTP-binding protein n=1 Tax=Clostridium saccharoperbutylacetonicum N1-4(HMT) TaxID=931276 RepID=M1MCK8_9CLOT|nr:tetracycline resistance ribosomal protection protein [Clostridium saccharoperbutylacetonicum]AGF55644.1 small GTP-binding protein [Clostridium saccharoperbutylacetonicum N1-4(HMT)]NRT63633.1 ribosomal protection tetracycline resistance protein [Clostridium saccharoperbutylacetonicum]NSB26996.1 ribosomal protection tetracycline resistance protein [Clostridium saccharoperbutylacetonicum]NSB40480.1 ribosomal protection tetracycline resistance protein [Clostridium saccharoperbutylacetonicum]